MAPHQPTPIIRITDPTKGAFRDAIAGAGGDWLRLEISERFEHDLFLEIVWDPPWNPSRMSEAARLQLGML